MKNYNTLTPEQKESINPYLKELFEEREKINKGCGCEGLLCNCGECIYNDGEVILCSDCAEEKRDKEDLISGNIKGFQEGLKIAIKQIDEELKTYSKAIGYRKFGNSEELFLTEVQHPETKKITKVLIKRIEELKKQKEHLIWESELE